MIAPMRRWLKKMHVAQAEPETEDRASTGVYGTYWDYYVDNFDRFHNQSGEFEYPGDEWGTERGWEALFEQLLVPAGVAHWKRAVEIGPGSGKYTLHVLDRSDCQLLAYDVSAKFIEVCKSRCHAHVETGRLELNLLDGLQADALYRDLSGRRWLRTVDAIYSIDSMVHVDLQYLIAYLITAGLVLKQDGMLILTLADVTNELGFAKLLRDISWTYPAQARPNGKFEWLSPDIVEYVLERLGFDIVKLATAPRDIHIVATLKNPSVSETFHPYIQSP